MIATALGVGGLITAALMLIGFIDAAFARWEAKFTSEESEVNK